MDSAANDPIAEADDLRAIADCQDEENVQEFFLALAETYELLAKSPKPGRPKRRP